MFHSNHEISGFHETWTPMGQYNVKTKYLSRHTYRVSKVLYQKGRTNRVSKVMMVIIIVMRRRRRRWWRRKMLKKMEKQKKTKITMVRHSWKWLTCREVLSHKEFCVSWLNVLYFTHVCTDIMSIRNAFFWWMWILSTCVNWHHSVLQ